MAAHRRRRSARRRREPGLLERSGVGHRRLVAGQQHGGASSDSNCASISRATSDAPQLPSGGASWATTRRFVRSSSRRSSSTSSGTSVRGSITSTDTALRASDVGRLDRALAHHLVRDERHVGPGAHDVRPAELDAARLVDELALLVEQVLVLEEEHRVGVLDRRAQQPVRVGRRRRHRDLQPGTFRNQFSTAWECWAPKPAPAPLPRRMVTGQRHLAAGHVAVLGQLVGDPVEADAREVGEHDLGDRAQPADRRPDRRADDRLLGDRRVHDPARPEALVQPLGHLERAARRADVLAEQEDAVVGLHGVAHRRDDRLRGRSDAHAKTSSKRAAGAGSPQSAPPPAPPPTAARRPPAATRAAPGRRPRLERALEQRDRVALEPLLQLAGRAVLRRVAARVALVPVGQRLDERRPLARARARAASLTVPYTTPMSLPSIARPAIP